MKKGFALVILAMLLFPSALWGLAWFFSAYKQAEEYCSGNFSLFHDQVVCREPIIALYIAIVLGIISIFIMAMGVKNIKKGSQAK